MTLLLIANSLSLVINFRFDLIKAIQDKGYTVHVATPDCNDLDLAKLEDQGVIFHQVSMSRSGLNPLQDLKTLWLLLRLIKRIQPDKVFAYSIKPVVYGMLAGFLAQVPGRYSLISGLGYAFVDDGQKSAKHTLVNLMAKFLYGLSLNRCHQVFFQNPDDEQLFRELSILRSQTLSMVVNGSGVNLQHFYPQPLPDQPVFLLVARLLSDKGIREYATAAKRLKALYPQAHFNLVGYLDENPRSITQDELDSWIQGGYINYLGKLRDVRPALGAANVFVLPSYREGTPRSVLEALAMGRAIITTDTPGCRETVREGKNGILVEPRSVDSLVMAMERLITNPELIKAMGAESLRLAQEVYDVDKVNIQMLAGMNIK